MCSGETVETLEEAYRALCASAEMLAHLGVDEMAEDEFVERGEDVSRKSEQEHCVELLTGICEEGPQILAQGQSVEAVVQPAHEGPADLGSVPDREQLEKLIDKPNVLEPFGQEQARSPMRSPNTKNPSDADVLPSTLSEALSLTTGDLWNHLLRLAIRLRSAKGGMDIPFLPNPKSCRKASLGLNWQQQPVVMWAIRAIL